MEGALQLLGNISVMQKDRCFGVGLFLLPNILHTIHIRQLDKSEFVKLILFGSKQIHLPVSLHDNQALYKKHSFLHSKAVYRVGFS